MDIENNQKFSKPLVSGKDFEVLYALKPFDDITLSQSFEYKGNRIVSIESAKHGAAADTPEKKG